MMRRFAAAQARGLAERAAGAAIQRGAGMAGVRQTPSAARHESRHGGVKEVGAL